MSLTDPQESVRRREAELKGSPKALTATLVFGFAALIAMAVVGFGAGGVFDQMRVMTINSVFGNWDSGVPVWLRAGAIPVGILASIICFGRYTTWNHRFTGRATYYAIVGPLTIGLFGLAAGVWSSTMMWASPDAVGTALDPVFHENEPWGVGAWVMYAAQWWLPGLLALLGLLGLLGRITSGKYRARNTELAAEMLRDGSLVEAEVVASTAPANTEAARVAATLTLRFDDAQGNSRWVTCPVLLPQSETPPVGAQRPLVFDPRQPGDTKRIFVSPTGRREAGDFLPVRRG